MLDLDKLPTFHDRKKVLQGVKQYGALLKADEAIKMFQDYGTAAMADYTNLIGGLPVNNFTSGRQVDPQNSVMKMGGDFIRRQNLERGGNTTHACMPGCMIECSNVYADKDGNEIVSQTSMLETKFNHAWHSHGLYVFRVEAHVSMMEESQYYFSID